MAKTWVLETHTKGTGANIVPLEHEREPAPEQREKPWVPHKPAPRPAPPPPPRVPHRFRVVEVTTQRVLADDAGAKETIEALRDVHSSVDVAISVWSDDHGRWRLLTHGEQQGLWNLREAVAAAGAAARADGPPKR